MDARTGHGIGMLACLLAIAGCTSNAEGGVVGRADDVVAQPSPTASADPIATSSTTTSSTTTSTSSAPIATTAPASASILDTQILVPDVVGFTQAEAVETLAALNLDSPVVVERESFKEPGLVIRQHPAPGVVARFPVELVVAVSVADVPDFAGSAASEARRWANDREIANSYSTLLTLDFPDGSVISQTPAAGEAAQRELALVVAQAPATMMLADLAAEASDDYGSSAIRLAGVEHPATPYFDLGTNFVSNETGFVTFDIETGWVRLLMTLGIDDTNSAESTVQIDVFIDGVLLHTEILVVGTAVSLDFDIAGASRLHISATALAGGNDIDVGLIDTLLVGDQPAAP